MDTLAFNIVGGIALSTLGFGAWWLARAPRSGSTGSTTAPAPAPAVRPSPSGAPGLQAHRGLLRAIHERTRFSTASFERDCIEFFLRVATHCETSAGSDLRFLLQQTSYALGYRQAVLLPTEVMAEDIEPRSYRWTFGLVIVSMLSEVRASPAWRAGAGQAGEAPAQEALRHALQPWLNDASLAWLLEDDMLATQMWASLSTPGSHTVLTHLAECGRCAALGLPAPGKPPRNGSKRVETPAVEPDAQLHAEPADERPAQPPAETLRAPLAALRPVVTAQGPAALANQPTRAPLSEQALAQAFMAWVSKGLAEQALPANAPNARVHFVSDGMVLAVPAIFNEFTLASLGADTSPMDAAAHSKEVQKAVCAEGWHLRGPQNSHLHRFQFARSTAAGAQAVVRGMVIQNPQRFLGEAMPLNPALSRLM